MKKIFGLLSLILLMAVAQSCNKNNDNPSSNDNVTEHSFDKCFAYVQNISTGVEAYYGNLGYQMHVNSTRMTLDLLITGLKLTDGTAYPNITIKNIPWTLEDNWLVVKAKDLIPSIEGFGSVPLFNTLEIRYRPRIIGMSNIPGLAIKYNIDTKFSVMSSYSDQLALGVTTSESEKMHTSYETTDVNYYVSFDTDTRRVTVLMQGARFVDGMPAFDIAIPDIPFVIKGTKAVWEATSVLPTIGGVTFATYPISNLKGEFDFGGDFNYEFDCDPEPMPGIFHVEAKCTYDYVKDLDE